MSSTPRHSDNDICLVPCGSTSLPHAWRSVLVFLSANPPWSDAFGRQPIGKCFSRKSLRVSGHDDLVPTVSVTVSGTALQAAKGTTFQTLHVRYDHSRNQAGRHQRLARSSPPVTFVLGFTIQLRRHLPGVRTAKRRPSGSAIAPCYALSFVVSPSPAPLSLQRGSHPMPSTVPNCISIAMAG